MPYEQIDTDRVRVFPLAQRHSQLAIDEILIDPYAAVEEGPWSAELDRLAERMRAAREKGAARILAYGAHLVKNGAQSALIELVENGWLTCVATNGAGTIHDFEFSFHRLSTESVRDNVAAGTFGTWDETGRFLHLAVLAGVVEGCGYGESVGRMIETQQLDLPAPARLADAIAADPANPATAARADLLDTLTRFELPAGPLAVPCPFREHSILGRAFRKGVPATAHPGIGYDIIYTHPMASGAAMGRGGYIDFRVFARQVQDLSGGVMLSVGSAIMAPQVYEKSQSLANNLLKPLGRRVQDHTIAVVDLADGGNWDWSAGEPPMDNPAYYLRFCKSYSRMGGDMRYFQMDNRAFLQALCRRLGRG